MKKILLVHPGTQHSFRVATALKESGMLFKFVTTVYNKDNSKLMKLLMLFLNRNNIERAKKRNCKSLDDSDVVQYSEWMGLISLILVRIDKSQIIYNLWNKWTNDSFQRKTVKYIKSNRSLIKAVIGYDTASFILFDKLAKQMPEIIRITDNAHSSRYYLHDVYNKIDSGKFKKTYINEGGGFLKSQKIALYYKEELLKSQYHIVASTFSRNAAIYTGISPEKIYTCPYGVDKKLSRPIDKDNKGPLKVLFVGEVNQRKGIYQILLSAQEINREHIKFNIVGRGGNVCSHLYEEYKSYVKFWGHVSFDQLIELYSSNHIFVFPSLGEGYGLVILEALSAGLPVICSHNCVGSDVVNNFYNGFVIDAGDKDALTEKIIWFDKHRSEMSEMSKNAVSSVENISWDGYNKCLIEILKKIVDF